MKFERDELIGMTVSVGVAVLFFAGMRADVGRIVSPFFSNTPEAESLFVEIDSKDPSETYKAIERVMNTNTKTITKLLVENVRVGEGAEVKEGSLVKVHYVGLLSDGTEFDNSYKRGEPIEFIVGKGSMIRGWEVGLLGMKEGGERILVIPPDLAYGERGNGPIPGNATLLFSLELLSVE